MFYSQLLLSKKGALGIVWMAAHCLKRLKKDQVQQTNISSSVDKILDDGVSVVTHRILAFLLLGIVRIYSKKVEYLFHDCQEILNKLCSLKTGKKSTPALPGLSRTHYHSISFPKRFELDAFDLELLEDQHLVSVNVGSHEEIMLADGSRKDGSTSGLLYEENIAFSEAHLTANTPPKDVFSPHCMDHHFARTSFSLEDRLDPMVLDEDEEEQMHHKPSNQDLRTNFQGSINDTESDSVVSPSHNRSHSVPSLEILRGKGFSSEDRVVLDEAEKEQPNDKPSNDNLRTNVEIQDMELDSITNRSPQGLAANMGTIHKSGGFLFEYSPDFKMLNKAENGRRHDEPCYEELVEHHGTGQSRVQAGSIDESQHVGPKKMKSLEVVTPESIKCQRPEVFAFPTPELKLPAAGVGTPEVATVQTPAPKERAKVLRKRKTLFDLSTLVPNKVLKSWIEEDPSDLKRERRKVPCTISHAWRARKLGHIPQSFFEPLISGEYTLSLELWLQTSKLFATILNTMACTGISMDLGSLECKKSCAPAIEKPVEISASKDDVRSPVTSAAHEQIPAVRSMGTRGFHEQVPAVGSPSTRGVHEQTLAGGSVTPRSGEQTPIAPGTPVAHVNSLRSYEAGAVADSDILAPTSSLESIDKCPCTSGGLELDAVIGEETNSHDEDSKEKDLYSARTRITGSYLGRKFLDKKRRKEEQVLNMSELLAGKTKKQSARLFYEILVLKTRDCVDVQQETAYGDILLREASNLKQASGM